MKDRYNKIECRKMLYNKYLQARKVFTKKGFGIWMDSIKRSPIKLEKKYIKLLK